jgi:hypothetical protein
MSEALTVFFSMVSPVIALFLAMQARGRAHAVTPILAFVVASILFINIGFITYYLGVPSELWTQRALLSVSWGILLVGLGGFAGAVIFRAPRTWSRFSHQAEGISIPYGTAVTVALVVFGIVLLYFYFLGYIPLFQALKLLITEGLKKGLLNTLRVARDLYINPEAKYIPFQGFMEAVRYFGLPIVATWFIHFYRRKIYPRVSLFMVGLTVLLILSSGQRWPLMYMLAAIGIYLTWVVTDRRRLWRVIRVLTLTAVLFGLVTTVLLARFEVEGLTFTQVLFRGVNNLFQRIFFGNIKIPFMSYQAFPTKEGWLYGQSWWQNLISYLPGPQPSFPVTFYQLVTGDPRGFTAPPDFYTEAYINGGWLGVVTVSFIWGVVLSCLQMFIALGEKSLIRTSMFALIATVAGFSALSGIIFVLGAVYVCFFIITMIYILMMLRSLSKVGQQSSIKSLGTALRE